MTVEIVERNCGLDARTASFFINSLGEMMRVTESIEGLDSLDIRQLADDKGFDWDRVCQYNSNWQLNETLSADQKDEASRWHKTIEDEWQRLQAEHLTPHENAFVNKVCELSRIVDESHGGRVRIYGQIADSKEMIVAVTEFIGFCDDDEFWTQFNQTVDRLDAFVWVMREEPCNEESSTLDENMNVVEKKFGPNHGRMERQVEVSFRVDYLTIEHFRGFLEKLCKETQELWNKNGVNVL